MAWYSLFGALPLDVIQVALPASGDAVIANGTTTLLVLNHSSLIVAASVTLPSNPSDAARFVLSSASAVTVLTMTADKPIKGTLATVAAGGFARYVYSASVGAWVRTG